MPEQLSDNAALLYILAALYAIKLVSEAFPNILGPISRGIHEAGSARRRAAADRRADEARRDDADIAELKRQVKAQEARLIYLTDYMHRHEAALLLHDQWDRAVMHDPGHALRYQRPPLYPLPDTQAVPYPGPASEPSEPERETLTPDDRAPEEPRA